MKSQVFKTKEEAIRFGQSFGKEFSVERHELLSSDNDSREGFYVSLKVGSLGEYKKFPGCAVHL